MSFQVQTGGPVSQVTFKWAAPPLLVREEVNKAVGVEEEEDWAEQLLCHSVCKTNSPSALPSMISLQGVST